MKPISFYHHYTRKIETEPVCGEWFMRFAYGNPLGRFFSRFFLARRIFSRIAGAYANSQRSRKHIANFIEKYHISTGESLVPIGQFTTFNEFFYRALRPECRPIDPARDAIIAPADARYTYIPDLSQREHITIKGHRFSLEKLLKNAHLAQKFRHGSAIIARLCPVDYHRFHFPCDGVPGAAKLLNGRLLSVHPFALKKISVFEGNKRYLTRIVATGSEVLMLEIGATFIGSIRQTYTPHKHVKKGAEKGFFSFGGSTVILIFEPYKIEPIEELKSFSKKEMEVFLRMGDTLAFRK